MQAVIVAFGCATFAVSLLLTTNGGVCVKDAFGLRLASQLWLDSFAAYASHDCRVTLTF